MTRIKVRYWVLMCMTIPLYAADVHQAADELAVRLKDGLAGRTLKTIAFLELKGPENSQFGTYMTDKLINAFQRETHISIFTRLQIEELIKEHKLNLTGIIDPKTTKKFGEMAQVDALATGKYIVFGESVEIAIQVFDVRTAQQIASAESSVSKTKDIINLLSTVNTVKSDEMPDTEDGQTQTAVTDNIYMHVSRITRNGQKITCEIELVNKGDKRNISFHSNNIHLNIEGTAFLPDNIEIFSKKHYQVQGTLPTDVKTSLRLEFLNTSSAGKKALHLDINVRIGRGLVNFEFRNIPIQG